MVISAAPPSYTWVRREHGGTHLNPPPPYQPRSPSPEQGEYRGDGIYALVKFSYRANSNEFNEINLAHGEIISQIDKVSEGWWAGTNSGGERGLFPSNFVSEIEEIDETAPAVPQTPTATAIYDYEAVEDNEIGFPDGAKITNIHFSDEGWWFGEYRGKTGLFPANYVQLNLSRHDDSQPATTSRG